MSDIFREVEEDVRRERFEKLWKVYGNYIIALLVLVFLGIGGWQLWERHEMQERQKISEAFMAAQRISNPQAAASAFADIARTAPKGYASAARLSQAAAMLASGQRGGIDLYKQIAKDDSGLAGSVARLRAAWALADSASRTELAELLRPLDQPGNAWRPNAREVLAYADYRSMDTKSALAKYSQLAVDPDSPEGLRARAKAMAAFLKNGGAVNYGTVPVPVVTLPPQAANAAQAANTPNPPPAATTTKPPQNNAPAAAPAK